ncbi:MAG: EFR1 family ferrodoxin [Candidatus Latescibacterota bacterium]
MSADIYFYSGTGNSLWAARRLAEELGDSAVHPIAKTGKGLTDISGTVIGLVFPVHIWGVPRRVLQFIDLLPVDPSKYYFAVAVNGGQVAATLVQLKKAMAKRGITLSAGYDLVTPSNYIPWGGPGPEEKWKAKISRADEKIKRITVEVSQRKVSAVEKGPLWQNILFSGLYKMSFSHVAEMDKSFHTDEKCNSCGVCEKICPAENIDMTGGRPVWKHRCEQCLACIQWCPREAIQYGKKTHLYKRYHHPDVTLSQMLACAPGSGKQPE